MYAITCMNLEGIILGKKANHTYRWIVNTRKNAQHHLFSSVQFSSAQSLNLSQDPSQIFPMNHLFTSDNQNTGASASASVLPVNS